MMIPTAPQMARLFLPNDDLNDLWKCNHWGMQSMATQSVTEDESRDINRL